MTKKLTATPHKACVLWVPCVGQALAVPVRRAAALSLKSVTSLDGAAVIRFVNHQGCLFGSVLLNLHTCVRLSIELA